MLRVKPLITALSLVGLGLTSSSALAAIEKDWLQGVTLSGLVEVNAFSNTDYNDVDSSDIQLATVELGIDAQVHKWASAHILFLYEEDPSS